MEKKPFLFLALNCSKDSALFTVPALCVPGTAPNPTCTGKIKAKLRLSSLEASRPCIPGEGLFQSHGGSVPSLPRLARVCSIPSWRHGGPSHLEMVSAPTFGGKRKMTGSQEMGAQQVGCSRLVCEGEGPHPLVGGQNQRLPSFQNIPESTGAPVSIIAWEQVWGEK